MSELDWDTVRQGSQQWLQMLSRAGISQIPVGDSESQFATWIMELQAVADDDSASMESLEHSAPSLAPANSETLDSPLSTATGGPNGGAAGVTGPKAKIVARASSGANPALVRSEDVIDDGADLKSYEEHSEEVRKNLLEVLNNQVKNCTLCPELVQYRTQTVFGVGNLRPRLVMMGEAPGADEDRLGEPMVGLAGQLLDKIIGAMKLRREDVYILNTVKCRPPQNRNPSEQECANCRPYWRQQLEILKPECIVCLGAVASKTLLQTTLPVGRLRGKFHDYRGVPVSVTYHPAYLLRTESAKRQTWDDMKMVMQLLGISI